MKINKYFNLTNSVLFWSFILMLVIGMVFLNNSILDSEVQVNQIQDTIEKQSYQNSEADQDIIDLNTLDYTDIKLETQLTPIERFVSSFSFKNNLSLLALLVYSIILSVLFTYSERSNRHLLVDQEAKMDQLKIDIERKKSKLTVYDEIEKGLLKYKDVLAPELNLDNLDQRISTDSSYIIFSSRVALEKILLKICMQNNIESSTLSDMIMTLYRKRILNVQTNSYAHTIKAFGNRVAHPNIEHPIVYDTKDALLVLSTFLTILNEFEANNLLEKSQDAA